LAAAAATVPRGAILPKVTMLHEIDNEAIDKKPRAKESGGNKKRKK
jgi:hypothetical protein